MASAISTVFILVVVYFGCPNVLAAPCTLDQVMPCMDGMSNFNPSDIDASCRIATSMTACIENLGNICDLDGNVKTMIDKSQEQMQSLKTLCKGSGGNAESSCSLDDMTNCLKGLEGDVTDLEQMCTNKKSAETCLKGVLNKCGNAEMKKAIRQSLDQFAQDPTCGNGDSQGCSMMDKAKCMMPLTEMAKNDKFSSQMCDATKEVVKCLQALKSNCDSDKQKEIDEDIKKMTEPMSDGCCRALVQIKEDCNDVENILSESQETKCMKLETAFNCINDRSPKCDSGPMKKGINDGLKEISEHLNSCKDSGYDIKVDYEKHMAVEEMNGNKAVGGGDGDKVDSNPRDSGTVLKQSIAVLTSAFLLVLFSHSF